MLPKLAVVLEHTCVPPDWVAPVDAHASTLDELELEELEWLDVDVDVDMPVELMALELLDVPRWVELVVSEAEVDADVPAPCTLEVDEREAAELELLLFACDPDVLREPEDSEPEFPLSNDVSVDDEHAANAATAAVSKRRERALMAGTLLFREDGL